MTIYIAVCPIGVFALKEGVLVGYRIFSPSHDLIAEKLSKFRAGESFEELDDLESIFNENVDKSAGNPAEKFVEENFRKLAVEKGFVKNLEELNEILGELGAGRSTDSIQSTERKDKIIIQSVSALNDMDKMLNTMSERLREWYGIHYPELNISDHEKFAEKIAEHGMRENFDGFETSRGQKLMEEDIAVLKLFARDLKTNYQLREKLQLYLESTVPREMPNLNMLLGSLLAARLLSLAGSLEKLAKMPSSKLQLLGAERSMFRFLKDKKRGDKRARPPKFGILFTHPDVSSAQREKQGKIARLLASKLTTAARADFYTKENIGKQLLDDYKRKLELIKNRSI